MLERVHPARIATGEWIMCTRSKPIHGWVSLYMHVCVWGAWVARCVAEGWRAGCGRGCVSVRCVCVCERVRGLAVSVRLVKDVAATTELCVEICLTWL